MPQAPEPQGSSSVKAQQLNRLDNRIKQLEDEKICISTGVDRRGDEKLPGEIQSDEKIGAVVVDRVPAIKALCTARGKTHLI